MAKAISTSSNLPSIPSKDEYENWIRRIGKAASLLGTDQPIFTTGVKLFEVYLKGLPLKNRQYHTCNTCKYFIDRFGSLVIIDAMGDPVPLMWDASNCPDYYRKAVLAMVNKLKDIQVTGVFLAAEQQWGTFCTGDWSHFGVLMPKSCLHKHAIRTASQSMAEIRENVGNVERALEEFTLTTMKRVQALLETENLYRGEKIAGPLNWLIDLTQQILCGRVKAGYRRHNLLWKAVAKAPEGFCHIRASVLGTLMTDLQNNVPAEVAIGKFKTMLNPLQYQRPQAPPKAGAIDKAEKIFETLGLAPALRRRPAKPEDIQEFIWQYPPRIQPVTSDKASVFEHLRRPLPAAPNNVTSKGDLSFTWVKFRDTILPSAYEIYVNIPNTSQCFCGLVAAADPDAPPILQWDDLKHRNTISWYFYSVPSHAAQFNLRAHHWSKVWGITPTPDRWNGRASHHGNKIVLLIEGARDGRELSLGLFPECLRSELHEVRSVIEAHCRTATPEKIDGPIAAGMGFSQGAAIDIDLRVHMPHGVFQFHIDRWD